MAMWGRTVWKDKSETWRCAKHIVRSSSESWGALCGKTSRRLGDVGTHCVERQVGDLAVCETHCAFQLGELGRTVWKDKSETWRCGDALCGKTSRRLGGVRNTLCVPARRAGAHCVTGYSLMAARRKMCSSQWSHLCEHVITPLDTITLGDAF